MKTYVNIPEETLEDVEIFQKDKRCKDRTEAFRRLVEAGLEGFKMQKPHLFETAKKAMTVLCFIGLSVTYLWMGGEDLQDRLHSEARQEMIQAAAR